LLATLSLQATAYGFSSRAAAMVTTRNSDLDALIAELHSSIVEYQERRCITPLSHARSSCVTFKLQVDGADSDGLAELDCQPEFRRSLELRPVRAPAGPLAPTVRVRGRPGPRSRPRRADRFVAYDSSVHSLLSDRSSLSASQVI
jgi:hypothetical protein